MHTHILHHTMLHIRVVIVTCAILVQAMKRAKEYLSATTVDAVVELEVTLALKPNHLALV